jgi:hypothetical protein
MEPTNRPYVDAAMEPGDAGTEPWADDPADSDAGNPAKRGTLADPVAQPVEGAAIEGSPADTFLTGDAVDAMNEDADDLAGD